MTRKEAEAILNYVKEAIKTMVGAKDFQNFRIEACGSYRRGKKMCGDVDILISRKDKDPRSNLLIDLVEILNKQKFIV